MLGVFLKIHVKTLVVLVAKLTGDGSWVVGRNIQDDGGLGFDNWQVFLRIILTGDNCLQLATLFPFLTLLGLVTWGTLSWFKILGTVWRVGKSQAIT